MQRSLVKEFLTHPDFKRQYQMKIFEAEDGEQCLELMRRHKPHLVFLDVDMPKENGVSVLKTIRRLYHNEIGQIPVIMTTAHDDRETVQECIQLGAKNYLLKPYDLVNFREKVSGMLD